MSYGMFEGKRKDTGEIVQGMLIEYDGYVCIQTMLGPIKKNKGEFDIRFGDTVLMSCAYEVEPDSVVQTKDVSTFFDTISQNGFEARFHDVVDDKENRKVIHSLDELKNYIIENGWTVHERSNMPCWRLYKEFSTGYCFNFDIEHQNDLKKALEELETKAYDFNIIDLNNKRSSITCSSEFLKHANEIKNNLIAFSVGVEYGEPKTISETIDDATRRSKENTSDGISKNDVEYVKE